MRIVRTNENLSGQTTDVSSLPDGHARQSYIGNCNLQGATIVGDIRGTDILRCDLGGANLAGADIYGCVWRGSTFDADSVFPDDVGPNNDEIAYELTRRYIHRLPLRWQKHVRDMTAAHAAADYTTWFALGQDILQQAPDVVQQFWKAMPKRMQVFWRNIFVGDACGDQSVATVSWPDGVKVTVNNNNLPSLSRPDDRYDLSRWIEGQAGPVRTEVATFPGRYCWVARIRPQLRIFPLAKQDNWLLYGDF